MSKEAMKLALEEYLSREMPEGTVIGDPKWWAGKIANVLAKQEQCEPVAWMKEQWSPDCGYYVEIYPDDEMGWRDPTDWIPLYTHPQQTKPLTDEQANRILLDMADHVEKFCKEDSTENQMSGECIRYILKRVAAHGIKE